MYVPISDFTNWAFYRPGSGKFLPEDIDVELCTHIVYGFAVLNSRTFKVRVHDRWVDLDNNFFKRVSALKKGSNRKVSLAIGGWNDSKGSKYSKLVNNPSARKTFIENVIPFLKTHDFDGLDLDWEYPAKRGGSPDDKSNFIELIRDLKKAFR